MNFSANTAQMLLVAFLIAGLCVPALAQEAAPPPKTDSLWRIPQLDELAADVAKELRKAPRDKTGKLKVTVFIFQDPEGSTSRFGASLSNAFAAALARELSDAEFLNQNLITQQGKAAGLTEKQIADEDVAHYLAQKAGAAVLITGTIQTLGETAKLSISATVTQNYKLLRATSATFAVPKEWIRLDAPAASLPTAGPGSSPSVDAVPSGEFAKRSIQFPECAYCPPPSFSTEAREAAKDKYQGTVLLKITVTAEGAARNVRVIRPLGHGLTEQAILAVKNWKFKPALGPNGKPVPVEVMIEVTFRLFK